MQLNTLLKHKAAVSSMQQFAGCLHEVAFTRMTVIMHHASCIIIIIIIIIMLHINMS